MYYQISFNNLSSNDLFQSHGSSIGSSAVPDMSSPLSGSGGNLSLTQKQKMLADSENLKRMATQPKLTPMASGTMGSMSSQSSTKATSDVKDLTSSLMSANLNQMKHSQSFTSGGFNTKVNPSSMSQGWY